MLLLWVFFRVLPMRALSPEWGEGQINKIAAGGERKKKKRKKKEELSKKHARACRGLMKLAAQTQEFHGDHMSL